MDEDDCRRDERSRTRPRTVDRRTVLAGAAALGLGSQAVSGRGGDQTSDATASFESLGTLPVDGLREVVVGPGGETAFGALRDGFVVVDVADPAAPTELARVTEVLGDEGDPVTGIADVNVSGDRLLVAGPDSGDGPFGFEVYDVSDPGAPARVTATPTPHAAHNCSLSGELAAVTGSGLSTEPVVFYDADTGTELSRWSVVDAGYDDVNVNNRSCHDVVLQGDTAYVAYWDAGTWLLDVSSPADPTPVGQVGGVPPDRLPDASTKGGSPAFFELPGNAHHARPDADGDRLAVGKEAWNRSETDLDGGPGGVALWDVSDPTAPVRQSVIAPPEGEGNTAHNLDWRGDRLYTTGRPAVHHLVRGRRPRVRRCRPGHAAAARRLAGAGDDLVLGGRARRRRRRRRQLLRPERRRGRQPRRDRGRAVHLPRAVRRRPARADRDSAADAPTDDDDADPDLPDPAADDRVHDGATRDGTDGRRRVGDRRPWRGAARVRSARRARGGRGRGLAARPRRRLTGRGSLSRSAVYGVRRPADAWLAGRRRLAIGAEKRPRSQANS